MNLTAIDTEGQVCDDEIHRRNYTSLRQRARYSAAMCDSALLSAGADDINLPDRTVILITPTDTVGDGASARYFETTDVCTGQPMADGGRFAFVNGANTDETTPLGRLMHDLNCPDPDRTYYSELAERVRRFKRTEGGIAELSVTYEQDVRDRKICSVIEALRDMQVPEDEIRQRIPNKYDLTPEQAERHRNVQYVLE